MRDKKAVGIYDVLGDLLKWLVEAGLKVKTKLMNRMYDTGE